MLSSNSPEFEQAIRASLLAMTARSFALAHFADSPEVSALTVTITRTNDAENPIDVDLLSRGGMAIGGMSL